MNAYDECYIEDAMNIFGEMFDYAVNVLNYDIDTFFSCFLSSSISKNFETGNPKYISGMSGADLALYVLKSIGIEQDYKEVRPNKIFNKYDTKKYFDNNSIEYWVGRIMAYFQWYKNISFKEIALNDLSPSAISKFYDLNKKDTMSFIMQMNAIFEKSYYSKETPLAKYRKLCNLTQKKLSELSGVSLRMIQLYEQRQNDLSKASVDVVINLANVLGCDVKELIR